MFKIVVFIVSIGGVPQEGPGVLGVSNKDFSSMEECQKERQESVELKESMKEIAETLSARARKKVVIDSKCRVSTED